MNEPEAFIVGTRSAIEKLFDGIGTIDKILSMVPTPVFTGSSLFDCGIDQELQAWADREKSAITASLAAQRRFVTEKYARGVLCGSVLNVACCALREFSTNASVSDDLLELPSVHRFSRYCVGRRVRDLPIGLIVYAARNAYNHYDDEKLYEPSASIFRKLATANEAECQFLDPLFNPSANHKWVVSSNVMGLLEWRCAQSYERDMRHMLCI